ncbi:MAG: hypothetical protein JO266_04890 [Acidobacteria bacterium]|nr:hypothetical protein [Acidobacteriota bacterium]
MPEKSSAGKKRRGRRRGGVRALRVPIKRSTKITSRDVERAIEEKLASTRTDVFGHNDTLVIVVEQQGHRGDAE